MCHKLAGCLSRIPSHLYLPAAALPRQSEQFRPMAGNPIQFLAFLLFWGCKPAGSIDSKSLFYLGWKLLLCDLECQLCNLLGQQAGQAGNHAEQACRQAGRQAGMQAGRQASKQAGGQAGRQACGQAGRQAGLKQRIAKHRIKQIKQTQDEQINWTLVHSPPSMWTLEFGMFESNEPAGLQPNKKELS